MYQQPQPQQGWAGQGAPNQQQPLGQWDQPPMQQQPAQQYGYGTGAPPPAYGSYAQQAPAQQPMQPQLQAPGMDFINDTAARVMLNPGAWQSVGGQALSMGQQYVNQNVRIDCRVFRI
jgi:hypothetical protein